MAKGPPGLLPGGRYQVRRDAADGEIRLRLVQPGGTREPVESASDQLARRLIRAFAREGLPPPADLPVLTSLLDRKEFRGRSGLLTLLARLRSVGLKPTPAMLRDLSEGLAGPVLEWGSGMDGPALAAFLGNAEYWSDAEYLLAALPGKDGRWVHLRRRLSMDGEEIPFTLSWRETPDGSGQSLLLRISRDGRDWEFRLVKSVAWTLRIGCDDPVMSTRPPAAFGELKKRLSLLGFKVDGSIRDIGDSDDPEGALSSGDGDEVDLLA